MVGIFFFLWEGGADGLIVTLGVVGGEVDSLGVS